MPVKTVAVIGAGASGLTAIKCCLDEGLEPTCFEKSDDIGGLWRYKDQSEDERASIYKSVIINTSKEMMCFSDYPIPEHFPNYMHNSKIMEYFRMYAKNFNLLSHVRFKTTVSSIKRSPNFATTGQWIITTEKEGNQEIALFDAVMICTGHHTFPNLPLYSFPGIQKFKGKYMHSREYKVPDNFKDKRIIVVGIGNSGGDIAVELSRTAQQIRKLVQLRPKSPSVSDTGVIFEDGTVEENIDAVIFATGYSFSFQFCEESVISVKSNKTSLYKFMFPYHLEKHTLAIVGLIQPIGAIMPISELQSRLATRVFKEMYVESQRHTVQVDYVEYMDELATLADVKPNLFRMFLKDPQLALYVYFGPCTPYQYRLTGPGKWSGARGAILTQWKRIIKPTQTRILENGSVDKSIPLMLKICAVFIVLTALFLYC
ncbi:hypothetical protein GDO81_017979 [Engystomops pustulosus]|uniref:Flavin-containing monooxygenase n=1 Tax=Engystomops pustulosus TaxID=76066 RepID=A0AAV7AC55_ENGPU|nr:hypothetical protein GDO81_017979 [Engystomops pustulosus]